MPKTNDREIKFRAWDKDAKEWVYFTLEDLKVRGLNTLFHNRFHFEHETQFTGLLDKNGKEIYEGDIVKLGSLPTEEEQGTEFVEKVWFSEGRFITTHYGFPVSSWAINEKCFIEVIGNIYENGDLIL